MSWFTQEHYWDLDSIRWSPETHQIMTSEGDDFQELRRSSITSALEKIDLYGNVLDLASGKGLTAYLKVPRHLTQLVAADLSSEMLKDSSIHDRVQMNLKDALPFAENTFDVITNFFSMRYLTRVQQMYAVEEMIRILKSGGSAHILDHTTISHFLEMAEFSPNKIMNQINSSVPVSYTIDEVMEEHSSSRKKIGPIYLLNITKGK